MRHHGSQFAIAECTDNRQESGYEPRGNQQRGRAGFARNLSRYDKDSGANHRPDDQHGGASQAETFDEFAVRRGFALYRNGFGFGAQETTVVGRWSFVV